MLAAPSQSQLTESRLVLELGVIKLRSVVLLTASAPTHCVIMPISIFACIWTGKGKGMTGVTPSP